MHLLHVFLAGFFFFVSPPISAFCEVGDNRIQYKVNKRLADGEKPNRLIDEKSPYLLQHAFNPVDWFPWGDEAFDKARKEDKPIFLSIGYSTCHWCHVMAEESFANQEIADILNTYFVSIKVDREERPDIDKMYMSATQAMTGSGGWPMSVFLLSDGSPFFAGTYFPVQSSEAHPGFKMILTAVQKAWLERRASITASAKEVIQTLEAMNTTTTAAIEADADKKAYDYLTNSFDKENGGFGRAPKFPRPALLRFLFDYSIRHKTVKAKQMALLTLDKMAAGGMYDQLGGGFHRYSTDSQWFVPHFEKMLYDQAQLIHSYLTAYLLTRDEKYAETAKEIITYTLRDLRDDGGGFYSAEDADSTDPYSPGRHGEGAFYLWTKEDIEENLSKEAATLFMEAYGVKKDGNVENDPFKEFNDRNILYEALDAEQAANQNKKDLTETQKSLQSSREKLFQQRQKREKPHLDDKIITSWNGLMIGALARAGRILGDASLLADAEKTALFLKNHLLEKKTQKLYRRYRDGVAGMPGQLDDYAYLVEGLLELYQAVQNPLWLKWAVNLTEKQIQQFWNSEGKYFYDSIADNSLKVRMREGYDGAVPAGNSVAAHNLFHLSTLQNRTEWLTMSRDLMAAFAETLNGFPSALPVMLTAWQQTKTKPVQVVIAGKRNAQDTQELLAVVNAEYTPGLLMLLADDADNQEYLAEHLSFIQSVTRQDGKATAYVCFDFTCKLPVTEGQGLLQQLQESKSIKR